MMFKECLENVYRVRPLVHSITNYVTMNDVANAILACGGSPTMANDPDDAEEVTAVCGGLAINIGTLHKDTIEAMYRAGRRSNELGHVLLLDPVGVGASSLRMNTAAGLIRELRFDAIRGNVSELKALALGSRREKGVDADAADVVTEENLDQMAAFARRCARQMGCIIAISGSIDLVADADRCYCIRNGRPEMRRVTGTGCQLSGIMTAYLIANPDNKLEAAAAAVALMGTAGEVAWSRMQEGDGNATYRTRIIDAIYNMTGDELDARAGYEIR